MGNEEHHRDHCDHQRDVFAAVFHAGTSTVAVRSEEIRRWSGPSRWRIAPRGAISSGADGEARHPWFSDLGSRAIASSQSATASRLGAVAVSVNVPSGVGVVAATGSTVGSTVVGTTAESTAAGSTTGTVAGTTAVGIEGALERRDDHTQGCGAGVHCRLHSEPIDVSRGDARSDDGGGRRAHVLSGIGSSQSCGDASLQVGEFYLRRRRNVLFIGDRAPRPCTYRKPPPAKSTAAPTLISKRRADIGWLVRAATGVRSIRLSFGRPARRATPTAAAMYGAR